MDGSELTQETFKPGAFIFLEGDKAAHFYIIQSGEVEIFTQSKQGKHVTIAKFGPGDSFGEFALLDQVPRSASARAITQVELVKINEEAYQHLLAQLPEWASCMLRSFAARLKSMTTRLKDMPQFIAPDKTQRQR